MGRENQVEGFLDKGQNVVVVEDLISTGKSSLNAVTALKAQGANVKGMIAIFSYGFAVAEENFSKENLSVYTLSNYDHLLEQAMDTKYINEEDVAILKTWRTNPADWK